MLIPYFMHVTYLLGFVFEVFNSCLFLKWFILVNYFIDDKGHLNGDLPKTVEKFNEGK